MNFEIGQRGFRTAWRSLVKKAAKEAGRSAVRIELTKTKNIADSKRAWKRAAVVFHGFRFHDIRHQSITEMAEAGVPEAAMQSIAGHLSKTMLDRYSHVRMAAEREAVEALSGGLIRNDITPIDISRTSNDRRPGLVDSYIRARGGPSR